MTQSIDLHAFDVFAFCRSEASAQGEIIASELPRIIAETAAEAPEGAAAETFSYTLQAAVEQEAAGPGAPGRQRQFLDVTVTGRVWLDCQRCLTVYTEPIATEMRFEVVASDAEAEAAPMDDDDIDVIVGSRQFDLLSLIEDEVLLALPVAPKHKICPSVHESLVTGVDGELEPEEAPADQEERRPSPFAALASLKSKH